MQLDIRSQGVAVTGPVQENVERRLLFALARFGPRVRRVTVYLNDLNGPRGGVDKSGRFLARLDRAGEVVVEDQDADLTALVDRAADRLGRAVQRALERRRGTRHQRPMPAA